MPFLVCFLWQAIEGLGTRLFIDRSVWFPIQLVIATLCWYYGTRWTLASPRTLIPILAGTVAGGTLAMYII